MHFYLRQFFRTLYRGVALLGILAFLATPLSSAEATTYQIRSETSARATQYLRSDTTLAAPRLLSQSLTLSAFNLRDNEKRDVNARVRMRYATDFALAERLRQDPLFDSRFNDLSLDLAFIQWRPLRGLELVGGRHWHTSSLGITDIDGISATWDRRDEGWRPIFSVAVGRDVQRGLTPWDPGVWDIQGLPPNEAALPDGLLHILTAARAGVALDRRHRVELAAQQHRRPRVDAPGQWAHTRRVGTTATTTPLDNLTLTANTSYHTTVSSIDRAHLHAALRLGDGIFSTGVDHRHPVFDSNSIFNLFGAQPYRSVYGSYRHRLEALSSSVELRTWSRFYFDEPPRPWSPGDERALGAALASHHRLSLAVPLDLFWQLSAQTMSDDSAGDQYLADARVRAPSPIDGLYLTGRFLGLWARQDHHRRPSGFAGSVVVGAELAVGEVGQLSLSIESRGGTFAPANTAAFAHFELEAWR